MTAELLNERAMTFPTGTVADMYSWEGSRCCMRILEEQNIGGAIYLIFNLRKLNVAST